MCSGLIPPFDVRGNLPPGVHRARWEEILDTFGGNAWRRDLLDSVERVARELRRAGCRYVWLDGSFVTDKEFPGDFDLCYDVATTDLDVLDPTVLDRATAKEMYGGDILPTHPSLPLIDFFQTDRDGHSKGIVEIDLGSLP